MAELLLELFSEEVPARMQIPAANQLRDLIEERLQGEKLFYKSIQTFVTPRRLVLFADGLSLTQDGSVVEKRGPRVDAPDQAIEGFLRSTGLNKEQLSTRKLDKGEFYFAIQEQKSKPTKEVLQQAVNDIIPKIYWPKSMRWGNGDVRWVRPLKNICCVFGNEIMPVKFGDLNSNNISKGHRFLAPAEFKVEHFVDYKKKLKESFVVLSHEDRKELIKAKADEIAAEHNLQIVRDESLLDEVTGLVEYPEVLFGNIDREFMHIPEEALISSIRSHQKYFCLRDKSGKLAPHFIVVSNMKSDDGGAGVIAGNERVLRARLADAAFFWDQDKKIPLQGRVPQLEKIIFHAKLGTIAEKTKRIQAIAKFLAVWVPHAKLEQVERAAELCKADLVTEMVGEFADLQGVMGAYYAAHNGEPKEIANAIKDHYSPLGPSDKCPDEPVAVAVAIADKMDTLAGLFAINEKPTGSKDPFALRRAALGIIRIILENKLHIPLRILIDNALKQYPRTLFKQEGEEDGKRKKIKVKPNEVGDDLLHFFVDRLFALLKGEGVRHDFIMSIFDDGMEDDILRVVQRVAALDDFLKTDDGKNLLAAYRRAANIVGIEEKKDNHEYRGSPSKALLEAREEKVLYNVLSKSSVPIEDALSNSDFTGAMVSLARLRKPLDAFFENVVVNTEQPELRKNRLKLLASIRTQIDSIANFEKIEG